MNRREARGGHDGQVTVLWRATFVRTCRTNGIPCSLYTTDFDHAPVTTESERDLSICEQSAKHLLNLLLAAQGKSIHDRPPHYYQEQSHGMHKQPTCFQTK